MKKIIPPTWGTYRRYGQKIIGSFSFRLYVLYFLMIGTAAWFIASRSLQAVNVSVNQAAEEVLIDTANLLASHLEHHSKNQLNTDDLQQVIPTYLARRFSANIYQRHKTTADLHIYVTDANGIVRYDSTGHNVGSDFSRWNDVKRTLSGQYGARVSDFTPTLNSVTQPDKGLFVAAPIIGKNGIIGVVTVIKSSTALGHYVVYGNRDIQLYAVTVFFISLFSGLFITWWLWRSIRKLSRYANQLGKGEHVAQPKIIHSEFKPLANAMEKMYQDLEGKEYIENYIHTLAHELKSPLSGMIATTELLQQDLPPPTQKQFVTNIHAEAHRMTALIERLLHLAMLENRPRLDGVKTLSLSDCVTAVLARLEHRLAEKQLTIVRSDNVGINTDSNVGINVGINVGTNTAYLLGEPFLIEQSIANLLDNAIDFSAKQSEIRIDIHENATQVTLSIQDNGTGISETTAPRLFERFFSTPRPDSQQRSSGLGLAFVKEVMQLHGGKVQVANTYSAQPQRGVTAILSFPKRIRE